MRAAGSGRHIAIDDRVLMADGDLLLAAACAERVCSALSPAVPSAGFVVAGAGPTVESGAISMAGPSAILFLGRTIGATP